MERDSTLLREENATEKKQRRSQESESEGGLGERGDVEAERGASVRANRLG